MQQVTVQSLLSMVLAAALVAAQNPALGLAMAKGSFRVDNSQVWNQATLVAGTTIETARVASELRLNSGARLALAAESRGRVEKDRLVLERGVGELRDAVGYGIEARRLKVTPAAAGASARVGFDKESRVLVAALNGPVRVTTDKGVVVANIAAGKALSFDPQVAGAAPPAKLRGCVERKDNRFVLTDETTKVTVELVGPNLAAEVGNVIELEGVTDLAAKPVAGATQVVKVSTMKRVGSCKALPAAGVGGWAGLSAGAKGAIVAGILVGTTVGILVATDVIFKEEKKPVSP